MSAAAAETITIPRRFNGPRDSGNGGYTSGILAGHLDGPVAVSLRSPVPLERPLELVRDPDGSLRLLDGEKLIAEAHPVPGLDLAVPSPVSPAEARRAAEWYRGRSDGIFSRCFVCGRAREDSLGVFAGRVEGRDVVASPWTPPAWTADDAGAVRPEFIWATLDCPTYFACHLEGELTLSMLVRQSAELHRPILAGEEYVVLAWPIAFDGRKRLAGAAILSGDGETLASGEVLLVEPRAQ
jgi:hypothetical protein